MKTRQTKKQLLYIVCFLFSSALIHAQEISTAYKAKMDETFQHIDVNKVPYGLLIDQALEFIEVSKFNGNAYTNENTLDIDRWRDIYKTLVMARVKPTSTMISPLQFEQNFAQARKARTITLTGLYYKYGQYKTDAYQRGLVHVSNQKIYDIAGKNPYDEKEAFAISPSVPAYAGKAIDVQFPSNLWLTNQASQIQKLEIDFQDGNGYQQFTIGQVKQILYTTAGKKEWKYKLSLTNGNIRYSHSFIRINDAPLSFLDEFQANDNMRTIGEPFDSFERINDTTIVLLGETREVEADIPFDGLLGRGFFTIDFSDENVETRRITRPLIVVEGLDTGHILNPEEQFGDRNIFHFRNIDMRNSFQLSNLVLSEYDIIYVDWQNGTDDIQRNARVLEAVIEWVNNAKVADDNGVMHQNVVIGQSMGGLVSKWCLRTMENENKNHDTRLFVSHDSPHLGANIPISAQYAYKHLGNVYLKTRLADWNIPFSNGFARVHITDRPAPRQLLINFVNDNLIIDNTVHDNFMQEYHNLGYPQQTRNIAITNGSECAETLPFMPNDELFYVYGNVQPSRFVGAITARIPFLGRLATQALISYIVNHPAPLIGALPGGRTSFRAEVWGKAYPENGVRKIYKGKLSFVKKILFWEVSANMTNKSRDNILYYSQLIRPVANDY